MQCLALFAVVTVALFRHCSTTLAPSVLVPTTSLRTVEQSLLNVRAKLSSAEERMESLATEDIKPSKIRDIAFHYGYNATGLPPKIKILQTQLSSFVNAVDLILSQISTTSHLAKLCELELLEDLVRTARATSRQDLIVALARISSGSCNFTSTLVTACTPEAGWLAVQCNLTSLAVQVKDCHALMTEELVGGNLGHAHLSALETFDARMQQELASLESLVTTECTIGQPVPQSTFSTIKSLYHTMIATGTTIPPRPVTMLEAMFGLSEKRQKEMDLHEGDFKLFVERQVQYAIAIMAMLNEGRALPLTREAASVAYHVVQEVLWHVPGVILATAQLYEADVHHFQLSLVHAVDVMNNMITDESVTRDNVLALLDSVLKKMIGGLD